MSSSSPPPSPPLPPPPPPTWLTTYAPALGLLGGALLLVGSSTAGVRARLRAAAEDDAPGAGKSASPRAASASPASAARTGASLARGAAPVNPALLAATALAYGTVLAVGGVGAGVAAFCYANDVRRLADVAPRLRGMGRRLGALVGVQPFAAEEGEAAAEEEVAAGLPPEVAALRRAQAAASRGGGMQPVAQPPRFLDELDARHLSAEEAGQLQAFLAAVSEGEGGEGVQ